MLYKDDKNSILAYKTTQIAIIKHLRLKIGFHLQSLHFHLFYKISTINNDLLCNVF